MLRPKINDIYMAYSCERPELSWHMQVVALLEFDGEKSIVCHKWLGKKPHGGQLYLFDMHGNEIDSSYMDFSLGRKSTVKSKIKSIIQ